ncbi:MAG: disulfide bond formation protein B [Candidatus Roizmanbacteria bacterium]|nr:disulfide bond formation protein B [Candidatus Roizmanbacteria bacterium]
MIRFITLLLQLATIASLGVVVLLCLGLYMKKPLTVFSYIKKRVLFFSFLMALMATSGSLFFSEIALFEPCKLCWLQRIVMYPQVVLFGVALLRKDVKIMTYTVYLSVIGASIALYHYGLNWYALYFPVEKCSVTSVSCTSPHFAFGFVNIPLMSFLAFIILLLLYKYSKE